MHQVGEPCLWEAKHIDISNHFAHEAVQNWQMCLYKIPTEYQLADLLTKELAMGQFVQCLHSLVKVQLSKELLSLCGMVQTSYHPVYQGARHMNQSLALGLWGLHPQNGSHKPLEGVFSHNLGEKPAQTSTLDPVSESTDHYPGHGWLNQTESR